MLNNCNLETMGGLIGTLIDEDTKTAKQLHAAITNNDLQSIHNLLSDNNNNNTHTNPLKCFTQVYNHTALYLAAKLGRANVVDLLLDFGADVNEHTDYIEWSPLMIAASRGHTEVVRRLLKCTNVNVNYATQSERT